MFEILLTINVIYTLMFFTAYARVQKAFDMKLGIIDSIQWFFEFHYNAVKDALISKEELDSRVGAYKEAAAIAASMMEEMGYDVEDPKEPPPSVH